MLNSKQLLDQTGLSRATLNNYIAAGLLPAPQVKPAEPGHGSARRLGYFPDSVLDTVRTIEELKRKGHSMAQIIEMVKGDEPLPQQRPEARPLAPTPASPRSAGLTVTIEALDCPAYMVNSRFEVQWFNGPAEQLIDGLADQLPAEIAERGLIPRLLHSSRIDASTRRALLEAHLSIARNKLPKYALLADPQLSNDDRQYLDDLYDSVEPIVPRAIYSFDIELVGGTGASGWHTVYVSFFREGVFFVYVPLGREPEGILAWLSRRDVVIRDILRKRPPCLTPVAVLVADLQSSVKICAELPPDEYFELINQLWSSQEPLLRKYHATHGKHVGDGLVHYFLPEPDSNYVLNAIRCAWEMRQRMQEISRQWRERKNWLNDLVLNIGLDAGEEWFGTYQSASYFEFTVLGDTVNRAARLSDFARGGAIWVTKTMLGKLSAAEREPIRYGIRRAGADGGQMLVRSTYARIAQLTQLDAHSKFNDIATLPTTELLDFVE